LFFLLAGGSFRQALCLVEYCLLHQVLMHADCRCTAASAMNYCLRRQSWRRNAL
jgi:hypothetical protein